MGPFLKIFPIFIEIWSYVQASIFSENGTFPHFYRKKCTFHRVYRYNPTFLHSNCSNWTHNFKIGASLEISPVLNEIGPYVQALFFQKRAHLRSFYWKSNISTWFSMTSVLPRLLLIIIDINNWNIYININNININIIIMKSQRVFQNRSILPPLPQCYGWIMINW